MDNESGERMKAKIAFVGKGIDGLRSACERSSFVSVSAFESLHQFECSATACDVLVIDDAAAITTDSEIPRLVIGLHSSSELRSFADESNIVLEWEGISWDMQDRVCALENLSLAASLNFDPHHQLFDQSAELPQKIREHEQYLGALDPYFRLVDTTPKFEDYLGTSEQGAFIPQLACTSFEDPSALFRPFRHNEPYSDIVYADRTNKLHVRRIRLGRVFPENTRKKTCIFVASLVQGAEFSLTASVNKILRFNIDGIKYRPRYYRIQRIGNVSYFELIGSSREFERHLDPSEPLNRYHQLDPRILTSLSTGKFVIEKTREVEPDFASTARSSELAAYFKVSGSRESANGALCVDLPPGSDPTDIRNLLTHHLQAIRDLCELLAYPSSNNSRLLSGFLGHWLVPNASPVEEVRTLNRLLRICIDFVGADGGAVWRLKDDVLQRVAVDRPLFKNLPILHWEGEDAAHPASHALRLGRPWFFGKMAAEEVSTTAVEDVKKYFDRVRQRDQVNQKYAVDYFLAWGAFPIRVEGRIFGVLILRSERNATFFTAERQELIKLCLTQASLLIRNLLVSESMDALRNRLIHDLRSPFMDIEDAVDALRMHLESENLPKGIVDSSLLASTRDAADKIEYANRMLRGTEILMDLEPSNFELMDEKDIMKDVHTIFGHSKSRYEKMHFQLNVSNSVSSFVGEKNVFFTLIHNLISNAVRHAKGDCVSFSLSHKEDLVELEVANQVPNQFSVTKLERRFGSRLVGPSDGAGLIIIGDALRYLLGHSDLKQGNDYDFSLDKVGRHRFLKIQLRWYPRDLNKSDDETCS